MTEKKVHGNYPITGERSLSIIVLVLFSSWMLSLPFQGQIFLEIAEMFGINPQQMTLAAVAATVAGLLFWGFLIKSKKIAKRLMLISMAVCIIGSAVFFYPPSPLWAIALALSAFSSSAFVAGWGYYFRSGTPRNERVKTAAVGLIYTNILMILLKLSAIYLSPYTGLGLSMLTLGVSKVQEMASRNTGLGLSMLTLGGACLFALLLPEEEVAKPESRSEQKEGISHIAKPLSVLCLFILVITINSGLMYQVINPAFIHLKWLASWYWAIPYIVAVHIMKVMRVSPRKIDRGLFLYIAIAMIGFSFVAFMMLDRSVISYIVVNTLMLGACGICDLFWWSILGEMLDLVSNPTRIFGLGLAANTMGVFIGGVAGNTLALLKDQDQYSTALALVVVCITFIIFPLLHRHLSGLMEHHAVGQSALVGEKNSADGDTYPRTQQQQFRNLSPRENQVAALLLQGKTYNKIADELYISKNTVKTHIKNIYSKYDVRSRGEFIDLLQKGEGHDR